VTLDAGAVLIWLLEHLTVLLIPLLIWMTRSLWQVSQTIYGTKGDNGLQGSVREAKRRLHEHGTVLQRHEGQLDRHRERLDGHDRELSDLRSR
jgi:hypothetical protein